MCIVAPNRLIRPMKKPSVYDPNMDEFRSAEVEGLAPLLAAFDVAAEEGHITRASDLLGIPQSSLSRRLKTLEKTLGFQLFQPVGRRVALTSAGRELHELTSRLVKELDNAVGLVRSNADPEGGLVRFGFPLTLGPISVPSLLAEFHEAAPRVRLNLVQAHGESLAQMVRDGRLDLAVMIPAPEDLPTTLLGHQQILLHVGTGHRLAARDGVDLAELVDETFIASPPTYHLRMLLDSCCMQTGFEPRVAFEITEFETIRALVSRGLGIALLPVAEVDHPDLVAVPVTGVRDRTIALAVGNYRLTPAVIRLRDHLIARATALLGSP